MSNNLAMNKSDYFNGAISPHINKAFVKKLYYKINFKLDGSKLGGSKFQNPLRSQYHIFEKPKTGLIQFAP